MKKLIYSQEDLDLILSLEIQEYEDKINNLQSKIDKAIEYIEKYTDKLKTTRIPKIDFNYNELLDILKEDK